MPRVIVVGAGIAGLAAAHALAAEPGLDVVLLEATGVPGGKLRTADFAGQPLDEGAEQVLARVPDALDLIREVGLGDDVVHPRTSSAALWSRGRLRPLPTGTLLGVPADPVAVARSGVLSPAGLARAATDLVRPQTPIDGDISVGAYVGQRAGREVVERLVDPLLGGVYAGRADVLSLMATVPQLAAEVRRHRTLLGAARAARATSPQDNGPVFATIRGGLGRLPAAVVAAGVGTLRTGATVRGLRRGADGFELEVGDRRAPEVLNADLVIVAVPAAPAARLLGELAPAAAAALATIEWASVATVALAYPRATFPPVRGSGFLVPAVEGRLTKAATFVSQKWAHADVGDLVVVRGSVGRHGDERDLQSDDADLIRGVAADLRNAVGAPGEPVEARVTRWGGGLPQYTVGHLDRVRTIRSGLPPGIAVCGAAYDGVGVPACIRSGREAATEILVRLREWPGG